MSDPISSNKQPPLTSSAKSTSSADLKNTVIAKAKKAATITGVAGAVIMGVGLIAAGAMLGIATPGSLAILGVGIALLAITLVGIAIAFAKSKGWLKKPSSSDNSKQLTKPKEFKNKQLTAHDIKLVPGSLKKLNQQNIGFRRRIANQNN